MIEWRGSADELDQLTEVLEQVQDPRLMRDIVSEVAEEVLKMIRSEFETSKDPYGTPWAPFVRPKDQKSGRKVLKKSGNLKASIKRRFVEMGFIIYSDSPYFKFPQFGTRRMVRRMILPMEVDIDGISGPLGEGGEMDVLMARAIKKVLARHDLDSFAEEGGVAVFEKQRNFRDDY